MFIDYTVIADWTKLVLPVISLLAAKFGCGSFPGNTPEKTPWKL